ncbi:glycosyltransferase [Neisseria dentiae]|uniref:glycosyltransferase n=1 Tax=Neisseria dentiae TaxID=194197 RepID=UPI00359FEBED
MGRKIKKLIREPGLFFKDMYRKHEIKIKKKLPFKYNGTNRFTVVSAAHNVAPYLNEYFKSLTTQTLNFKKHIYLILVDDGSTDHSAEIIKKWQKRFPNNIRYIYQENGGISSARNTGLKHVATPWVTFIDADDFVHPDYFKAIDDVLAQNESVKLAVGNLKFYFDANRLVKDKHALRYRFDKKLNIVPISKLGKNINLFVTVSFFQTAILHDKHIVFDERIKPNFEDGKFLADYCLHTDKGNAAYLQNAVFFYRKRGNGSSTIDNSWLKKEKYRNTFLYGYIPMLQAYREKYGLIPQNIQWTVLYEIFWHIRKLLNHNEYSSLLTAEETAAYRSLITETLAYIDDRHINDFDLIGIGNLHKTGLMGLKNSNRPPEKVSIEYLGRSKQQVSICCYSTSNSEILFLLNGQAAKPSCCQTTVHFFAGQPFVYEKHIQIPYNSEKDMLAFVAGDGKTFSVPTTDK